MEACFCCYLDTAGSCLLQDGNCFDGGEMDDVELELGGEMGEREDFFYGISFERWGARGEECVVGVEGAGGGEWWEGDLDVVAY